MSLIRNISYVLGFGRGLNRVAVICVLATATLASFAAAAADANQWCHWIGPPDSEVYVCEAEPGTNQGNAPVFTGTWYAAIAKSSSSPFWGASWHEKSQADAQRSALSRCNKGVHADCKVVVQGVNNCISLSESHPDGAWGVAISQATTNCRKYGGHACAVVITPCGRSLPNDQQCVPFYSIDISRGAVWARMSPQEKAMWNKRPNGACK